MVFPICVMWLLGILMGCRPSCGKSSQIASIRPEHIELQVGVSDSNHAGETAGIEWLCTFSGNTAIPELCRPGVTFDCRCCRWAGSSAHCRATAGVLEPERAIPNHFTRQKRSHRVLRGWGNGYSPVTSCQESTDDGDRISGRWCCCSRCCLIAVLLFLPVGKVFLLSFTDAETGQYTLDNYARIFSHQYYVTALNNTLIVGLAGMLGACLLGIPLAYCMSRYHIPGKALISTLAVLALVSPPFIGAYAWIMIFGANGVVTNWFKLIWHRSAHYLRLYRHRAGFQPEVLSVRLSDDRKRVFLDQQVTGRGSGESGLHTVPAIPESDLAAGVSGGQHRRHTQFCACRLPISAHPLS